MKLERLRLATQEEIDSIVKEADLTASSRVLVQGSSKAVWRICNEIDPMFYEEGTSNQQKGLFINNLQNFLIGAGASEFYFNIPVADEVTPQLLTSHFGAQRTSKEPEYRYKITL